MSNDYNNNTNVTLCPPAVPHPVPHDELPVRLHVRLDHPAAAQAAHGGRRRARRPTLALRAAPRRPATQPAAAQQRGTYFIIRIFPHVYIIYTLYTPHYLATILHRIKVVVTHALLYNPTSDGVTMFFFCIMISKSAAKQHHNLDITTYM